jgi:hypothetical protein
MSRNNIITINWSEMERRLWYWWPTRQILSWRFARALKHGRINLADISLLNIFKTYYSDRATIGLLFRNSPIKAVA